jgi:hypothetical protein
MDAATVLHARDYVREAARSDVIALSPSAVADRVGCNATDAEDLLLLFEREGLIETRGYVECPRCGEYIPLVATTVDSLRQAAAQLSGHPCPTCHRSLPTLEELRVSLSFFFKAAAKTAAKLTTEKAGQEFAKQLTLDGLDDLTRRQINIVAQYGSTVLLGSPVTQSGGQFAGQRITGIGTFGFRPSDPSRANAAPTNRGYSPAIIWALATTVSATLAAGLLWWIIPGSWPKIPLVTVGAAATAIIVQWLNPASWYRRTASALIAGLLSIRGLGVSGALFADTSWGKFFGSLNNDLPWSFDLAIAAISIVLIVVDFQSRR